jgi:hypothetical protein
LRGRIGLAAVNLSTKALIATSPDDSIRINSLLAEVQGKPDTDIGNPYQLPQPPLLVVRGGGYFLRRKLMQTEQRQKIPILQNQVVVFSKNYLPWHGST